MAKFFIGRPIVAIVIAIIIVLAGVIVLRGLPEAINFPDIVPPQIIVSATYPGADAQTVEQSVATPIEQQMNGVEQYVYMQSTNDNTMQLTVTFDVDTDVNTDQVNVQNRVAQATPNLPPDVTLFGTTILKSTGLPLMAFAFTRQKILTIHFFWPTTRTLILSINSLAHSSAPVSNSFRRHRLFHAIRLLQVLAKLGLTVNDWASLALNQQNAVNPAGQVAGNPAPGHRDDVFTVRIFKDVSSPPNNLATSSSAQILMARSLNLKTSLASNLARSVTTNCRASMDSPVASSPFS